MNYWLVKSEPSVYSWDKLLFDKVVVWDGVRNYAARNNLRSMKYGDPVFFYHSNEGMCIVGICVVVQASFQDPTTDADWSAVKLGMHKTLTHPVSLALMKSTQGLQDLELIKQSRLSVCKVTKAQFGLILELGKTNF